MHPNSKAAILKAIKQAEKARLDEQDFYGSIIEKARKTPVTEEHEKQLSDLGFEGIEKHMAGESWPPASQDWRHFKGYAWNEIPKRKRLDQIADKDIRYAIYFYSEIAEHTLRIKAIARYCSLFGAVNDNIYREFISWRVIATLKAIKEELGESAI